MPNEIQKYKEQIEALCRQHNVRTLFAFGSVLSDRFSDKSDVDLIVDIDDSDPYIYTDNYFDLKFKLENLFNRPVDLLEDKALRNPYLKKEINNTKVLVYGK